MSLEGSRCTVILCHDLARAARVHVSRAGTAAVTKE